MKSGDGKDNNQVFLIPEGEIKSPRDVTTLSICALFVFFLIIGVMNLYSATSGEIYLTGHFVRVLLGVGVFVLFGWFIPVRVVNSASYPVLGTVTILLILVLVLGKVAGGSQRWISLGPLNLQPSEFAKLAVAMTVARFFHVSKINNAYRLADLRYLGVVLAAVFFLVFKQPDLGTAGVCILIALAQIAFLRFDMKSVSVALSLSLIVAFVGWNFLLHDYQKLRIINLFNPNLDPQGSGYNSIQSLVAVGSGNLFGKGFMKGTQTQLQFLPARHTDFIFSVFAEEQGFVGSALVFILFGFFTYLMLSVARKATDTFSGLLSIGIASLIFIEFSINVAMVMGIFPVVGMPLPFFSYGGSSLLTNCVATGMVIAVHRYSLGTEKKEREFTYRTNQKFR